MTWLFGGPWPGVESLWPRLYIAHVLLFPILIGTLLGAHLVLVALRHHTQFKQRRETEQSVVGVPTWPGQAPRSLGLMLATAGVLFLLGGLVQINPIWLWGPYHTWQATNGAQPDWYLGWLIGALRLVPGLRRRDRQLHAHAEPVLGRRGVPADRDGLPLSLAVARAQGSRATTRSTTCSTARATRRGAPRSASRW